MKKDEKRLKMVEWFNIPQLAATGLKVILSTFIGQQSDRRIIQAIASGKKEYFDYSKFYKTENFSVIADSKNPRTEMWLDYISDTGDGWNSTYAVAYYASAPNLQLKFNGKTYETKRGEVLIFGGDEVYPTPSKKNYQERLVHPYETAFGDDNPALSPHVFAIPGNHDWYDGLSAFTRLFCSDLDRSFAGWITRQKRSYFALKLPAGWWLFGSDGQLQSDIDTPQIEYFRKIVDKHMTDGDRVILCISQPNWIYAAKYKKFGEPYDESDLIYLQNEILAKKNVDVKVYLSGDLHHYRRHEEVKPKEQSAKVQKITAGGGGAFLHPTHDVDVSLISEDYGIGKQSKRKFKLQKSYPEIKKSKQLCFGDLLFFFKNPQFGLITGFLYLMTAWIVWASVNFKIPHSISDTIRFTAEAFYKNPIAALWIALIIGAFIVFTDTHSRLYKWVGGLLHAGAHFISIFYVGWGSVLFISIFFKNVPSMKFIFSVITIFFGGWIAGSIIMGVYLFISQYFFGRHNEEAFSALKIQDYKNFLRMHIAENGTLTIYPVKIERVPRKWKNRQEIDKNKIKSFVVPVDGSGAELIEEPIVLHPGRMKV